MTNLINSINNGYTVSNAGLNQEQVQASLAKSKQAVSDNFENTTAGKAVSGATSDPTILRNTVTLLPALMLLDKVAENGISGKNGKGVLEGIAKFGDKISDKLHLEKVLSEEKSGGFRNFLNNNRFTKYFTRKFQAIPKSSMAKTRTLSEEYFSQLPSTISSLMSKLNADETIVEAIKTDAIKLTPETKKLFTTMVDGADDALAALPKEKIMSLADELVEKGLDVGGKVAGLRNKVNVADLKTGKTLFGKLFAKGTLKTKNILTYGGGLISLMFTANALAQTIKETKEAPKGEKLSTFMHVLSEQYLGIMLFQPSISLLYKVGGNKYRGMTPEARTALTELIKNADKTVDGIQIAKLQQKLLQQGKDVDIVKSMSGKTLAEAKKIANGLNGGGLIAKIFNFIKSPIKTISNLFAPNPEISSAAKDAIKEIGEKALKDRPSIVEASKIAKIQKDLLLRGVDKDKVAKLSNKGLTEVRQLAKGLKKEGAKLKFWEKPLKFFGQLLDTGLDTMKSPTATGTFSKKLKGFLGGFARFALIMFVIQPFIQKPITKLINKIFGKPKTYLAKQNAGKTPQNGPTVQRVNTQSTNLLEQFGVAQIPTTAVNPATSVAPQQRRYIPSPVVNFANPNQPAQAISATRINSSNRYIPSIVANYDNSTAQVDAQVDSILKSTDSIVRNVRKHLH